MGPEDSTVTSKIGINGMTISEAKSLKKLTKPRMTTVRGNRCCKVFPQQSDKEVEAL
jgi:hypothetical protein